MEDFLKSECQSETDIFNKKPPKKPRKAVVLLSVLLGLSIYFNYVNVSASIEYNNQRTKAFQFVAESVKEIEALKDKIELLEKENSELKERLNKDNNSELSGIERLNQLISEDANKKAEEKLEQQYGTYSKDENGRFTKED